MKKLLIAEDDPFLIKVYEAKLKKEGFEFRIAKNGQEALDLFESFKPDVVALDLIMPKKDGFEVLKEIKSKPEGKNVKVIIFSNLSQPEDKERVKKLGAEDFIVKSDNQLKDIVDQLIKLTS